MLDDIAFIDEETHNSFNSTEIILADVLLNITGASIGRSVVADSRVVGGNVNQHVCIIRTEHNRLNSQYLCYFLLSGTGQSIVESFQAGGNRQGLNFEQIKRFSISLPPPAEQQAIAEALRAIDALLASQARLLDKKRQLKQATLSDLLGQRRRLPGFSGEWEHKTIGQLTDVTSGGTPDTDKSAYWGGNIRWMSSGDLHLKYVREVGGRISELGLKNSSTKMIPPKCVLIGLAGQGKTRGTAAINLVPLCTNQSIAAILPTEGLVPEFLYHNIDNRYGEMRTLSTGEGGRGGLNLRIIKSVQLHLPPPDEQRAIAQVLGDQDADIALMERQYAKTQALKQGMMQELLSGNTRL